MSRLSRGDLGPEIVVAPPGPRSRALAASLARHEAPAVNTLWRGEPAVVWEEALGANILDVDGNRYIDFTAGFGVAAIGHRHPQVVAAIADQAQRLLHGLGDVAAHPPRIALAERLAALAPLPEAAVYFAVSGSDAVEVALKTAVLVTGRPGILAFEGGYHGLSLGALAATSRAAFRQPFAAQLHPHVSRAPFGARGAALRTALLPLRDRLAAILVEPLLGRGGIEAPPAGWLAELAELARDSGALLVIDEVFTGFGRTGRCFAVEHHGVVPDLVCCGKALGGGLPIAAVLGRRALLAAWPSGGEAIHTGTFLAHPLACAAALATLDVLDREGLIARAAQLGGRIGARLEDWPRRHASVRAVRGQGLAWALLFASARQARSTAARLLSAGVFALASGEDGNRLQIVPPLVISQDQLDAALDLLEEAVGPRGAA